MYTKLTDNEVYYLLLANYLTYLGDLEVQKNV